MYGKNYKIVTQEVTLSAAIDNAYSEIGCLADEIGEWRDSMEGSNLESTPKYEQLTECFDQLDSHRDGPAVPDFAEDIKVNYSEGVKKSKRRGPSRAARLGNAVNALNAAVEALDTAIDDDSADNQFDADQKGELESLRDSLQETIDEVDGVEFPGMFR